MPAGQVMVGGVVSSTITSKEHIEALLSSSVAETVTVVVPSGNVLPEAGTQTIDGEGSQTSMAAGEKVTISPAGLVHSSVMSEGHVTIGGVVSMTVTLKEQVSELPESSVAEQFTVVVPIAKVLPEGGTHTTVGIGS